MLENDEEEEQVEMIDVGESGRATPGAATAGEPREDAWLNEAADDDGAGAVTVLPAAAEATILSTIFGLSNNIVGAGILSLPWCMKQASIVEGVMLMVLVGVLSGLSLVLIAVCCELTECFSFRGMGERTLGPRFGVVLQGVMLVYTFFSCVSFMILAGDFLSGENGIPRGLCGEGCDSWIVDLFNSRFNAVALVTLLLLCPLSSLRELNALRFTSLLSVLGMLYLLGLLVYAYVSLDDEKRPDSIHVAEPQLGIFSAAPIVNVAFIAHYNVPRFYEELKDRSIGRFATAVASSLTLCGASYIAVGVFGYLRFGADTESDVLNSFDDNFVPAIVGRMAMACVVLFTYPLVFNSLRASTLALLADLFPRTDLTTGGRFLALTFSLVGLTFTLGSTLSDIGVVLDYKGAILGGCIGFAFPAWIFLAHASPRTVSFCCVKPVRLRADAAASEAYAALPPEAAEAGVEAEELHAANALLRFWRGPSLAFFVWAIVSGVMGVVITTEKIVNGET